MPYIGAGIQKFNTADGLTVSGSTELDGAVVVNESSADADFRVESNGNANMLFVDAGNDKVAIGTGTAVGTLTTECTAGNSNFALTAYHPTSTSSRTIAKFQSDVGSTQADVVTIGCDGGITTTGALDVTTSTHANASVFKSTGNTQIMLQDTDASANDQFWGLQVSGGAFNILTCDDDRSGGFVTPLTISQAGDSTFTGFVEAEGGNAPTGGFQIKDTSGNTQPRITNDANNATVIRAGSSSGGVRFNNFANSSEMVVIDNSGNLTVTGNIGAGTTSPTQPLSVSASGANGLFLLRDEGAAANSCRLFFDSSNTRYAILANDGVLSVRSGADPGNSSGTERVQFTVNGINSSGVAGNTTVSSANLFISGGNNFQKSTSSRRYKTDIADATHGLSDVLNLRSVTYKGVNDGETVFGGLIAEEVHDAGLTEFVNYSQDDDGNDIPEGVHYGHMVALAFKAIQELKTELDAEKAKTATLQTQVADLITRVTKLEGE